MAVSKAIASPFRAYREIATSRETKAGFWDINLPGKQDEILDDAGLRAKLANLVCPLWRQHSRQKQKQAPLTRLGLILTIGFVLGIQWRRTGSCTPWDRVYPRVSYPHSIDAK
jgi:hypothetical protein